MVNKSDDKKRVYFGASEKPLKSNIATIHESLVTNATLNVQSYWSTFGSWKETKKSLVMNGELLEKCFVMQKTITVYCV